MKILSIGNSFSQDAQRYFAGVCRAAGVEVYNVNLYIGGCSLERHVGNIGSKSAEYMLEIGGNFSGRYVTVDEMLTEEKWDIITLQEVSQRSFDIDFFKAYLPTLADYVRKKQPYAKIALHMTWGYKTASEKIAATPYACMGDMFADIDKTYAKAESLIGADLLIPSGRVIQRLADEGYEVHRDGFHLGRGLGRYAAALCWLKALFGISVLDNGFSDFDEEISAEEILAAKRAAEEIV